MREHQEEESMSDFQEQIEARFGARYSERREPSIVPGGDYIAEVWEVQPGHNPSPIAGEDPKQVHVTYGLLSLEGDLLWTHPPDKHLATATLRMSTRLRVKRDGTPSKSLAWSQAILNRKIDPSEFKTFNFNVLKDCRCLLTVDDTRPDGVTRHNTYKVRSLTHLDPVVAQRIELRRRFEELSRVIDWGQCWTQQTIDAIVAARSGPSSGRNFGNLPPKVQRLAVNMLDLMVPHRDRVDTTGDLEF